MNAIKPRVRKPAYSSSPHLIEKVCQAIEQGLSVSGAAKSIGMSHATLYRWISSNPQIKEQVEAAKDRLRARLLTNLLASMRASSDWRAYAWLLERHFPETYGRVGCRRCSAAAKGRLVSSEHSAGLERIKAALRENEP